MFWQWWNFYTGEFQETGIAGEASDMLFIGIHRASGCLDAKL